jgi:hypothetical protein
MELDNQKEVPEGATSPTGRIEDRAALNRRIEKTALFAHRYSQPAPPSFDLEMDFAEMERRMSTTGVLSELLKRSVPHPAAATRLLRESEGTTLIFSDYCPVATDNVPPGQDFAKAKTASDKLKARLSSKKSKTKPSGLLAKLVGKK